MRYMDGSRIQAFDLVEIQPYSMRDEGYLGGYDRPRSLIGRRGRVEECGPLRVHVWFKDIGEHYTFHPEDLLKLVDPEAPCLRD